MPTYEYACTACGHRLEAVQKFTDEPLSECPECGSALRKVYGAVGIVLKGSGFYKTDSRAAAGASNGKGASKENKDSKDKEKESTSSSSSESSPSKKDSSDSSSKSDGSKKDGGGKDAKPAAATASSS
ncbi:MAG TPA: FmdB family zinc ribbon protein [Acidimicrobiales bacterium]|nr:FmdB family zinc ribbon protein [Acidimicrobiales bacterium]